MTKLLKKLLAGFMGLTASIGVAVGLNGGKAESVKAANTGVKTYSFSITKDNFTTSGYAANDGDHTSIAVNKTDSNDKMEITWCSSNVYSNGGMQWKSNAGYIYNKTDLGNVTSIDITTTAGSFTKYIGSSQEPTSSASGGFFKIKAGSSTPKSSEVKVTFEISVSTDPVSVSGVTLSESELSLLEGESATLTTTITPSNATNKSVTWSSDNTGVATVVNGVVTAVKPGTTTITVTTEDGNKTASCAVTVNAGIMFVPADFSGQGTSGSGSNISATHNGITLSSNKGFGSSSDFRIYSGGKLTITGNNREINSISIASTSASYDGNLNKSYTGLKTFSWEVTTSEQLRATSITVLYTNTEGVETNVTGVSLNSSEISVLVGKTKTLEATITPSNATNQNIAWSSNDSGVATVDDGVVTAIKPGTTTITVTTEDGGFTASCLVTVRPEATTTHAGTLEDPYTVTDAIAIFDSLDDGDYKNSKSYITGVVTSDEITIDDNNRGTFNITDGVNNIKCFNLNGIGGEDFTSETVYADGTVVVCGAIIKYVSSSETIAEIGYKTGISANVVSFTPAPVTVSSVSISGASSITSGNKGLATVQLTATVSYSGKAGINSVTWSSSDEDIATVDDNGLVTFLDNGTVTITATSDEDNTKYGTHEITASNLASIIVKTASTTINDLVSKNSYTVSANNVIGDIVTSFNLDENVVISTNGDPNCGSFWGTTTKDWRLYQAQGADLIITVPENTTLISCKITYSNSNSGSLYLDGTKISTGTLAEISGTSVTFDVRSTDSSKTNGQVRVTSIEVTYSMPGPSVDEDIQSWIDAYLYLEEYTQNLGYCADEEHGYYAEAKEAMLFFLSKDKILEFQSNDLYADAYARYVDWAKANGDATPFAEATGSGRAFLANVNNDSMSLVIIVSVGLMVTAISYALLNKKKKLTK